MAAAAPGSALGGEGLADAHLAGLGLPGLGLLGGDLLGGREASQPPVGLVQLLHAQALTPTPTPTPTPSPSPNPNPDPDPTPNQAAVSARVARHYLDSSSLRERDLGAFHLQVMLPSYHP